MANPPSKTLEVYRKDLFAGKTVFISGGGSGIGLALTRAFMRHGANACIASR